MFKDGDFSFSSEVSLSGTNNDYYELTADGEFHMIARVDDTMLWSEADESYKADIIDAVKMLGYK